jgi:SAM-dependent methyltransferase
MLLQTRLREKFGDSLAWNSTACNGKQEETFRGLLEGIKPKLVLEIGTHQGISTALLAEYAEKVVTVDIIPNALCKSIWQYLGVAEKIESHVFMSQQVRDDLIVNTAVKADLIFIDGGHLMRDVEYDFSLCSCTTVLFHDYWDSEKSWPDIKEFVDSLVSHNLYDITITPPFALVRTKI